MLYTLQCKIITVKLMITSLKKKEKKKRQPESYQASDSTPSITL